MAIRSGGVYTWGYNAFGQLGDGTTTNRLAPVALSGTLSSGVTAIAGGYYYSLAIQNGGVYAWGANNYGQLGDGTTTERHAPVALTGTLSSGVTAIAGSFGFCLAIQSGHVYAWGSNGFGELGDGTTTQHLTPELIDPTDLNNVVAIATAGNASYALSSDGSLWTWGYNSYGELGLGNTTEYDTPQHLLPPAAMSSRLSVPTVLATPPGNAGPHTRAGEPVAPGPRHRRPARPAAEAIGRRRESFIMLLRRGEGWVDSAAQYTCGPAARRSSAPVSLGSIHRGREGCGRSLF